MTSRRDTAPRALRRKDRFPTLPLGITLRETGVVMHLNWRALLTLAWIVFFAYVSLRLGFTALAFSFGSSASGNYALYLFKIEVLGLVSSFLLEVVLVGFYTLAVYRLMLLGEPLSTPKFSDVWLRRYVAFLGATIRAIAWPSLVFIPYALAVLLQIIWASGGGAPDFVPDRLIQDRWPTQGLKILSALGFYIWFARLTFVQPAAAVDVPYSPRESWRVTNWIWGHMLIITFMTLGMATLAVLGLWFLWPEPSGALRWVSIGTFMVLACGLWLLGVTAFVVSLSIAFCLRTGWRPGAKKLSLKRRPTKKA